MRNLWPQSCDLGYKNWICVPSYSLPSCCSHTTVIYCYNFTMSPLQHCVHYKDRACCKLILFVPHLSPDCGVLCYFLTLPSLNVSWVDYICMIASSFIMFYTYIFMYFYDVFKYSFVKLQRDFKISLNIALSMETDIIFHIKILPMFYLLYWYLYGLFFSSV